MGKPEGKRPLRRPRPGWEDNIIVDFEELGHEGYGLDLCGSGYRSVTGCCAH